MRKNQGKLKQFNTADLIPLKAVISTIFFLNKERKFVKNVVLMNEYRKDGCKLALEAANVSDIWYLFGRENCIFIRENLGKARGKSGKRSGKIP